MNWVELCAGGAATTLRLLLGPDVDPPYKGRTRYAAHLERDEVLVVARRWSDAGCVVAVSEAEPLPLEGWHHVDLSPRSRRGAKSPEWLTVNVEPVAVPARQLEMHGVAWGWE